MVIKITEDEKTKKKYLSYDDIKCLVSFDNLVLLAKIIIDKISKNKDEEIKVEAESSLELYRYTIQKLVNDVISDEELLELLTKKEEN